MFSTTETKALPAGFFFTYSALVGRAFVMLLAVYTENSLPMVMRQQLLLQLLLLLLRRRPRFVGEQVPLEVHLPDEVLAA